MCNVQTLRRKLDRNGYSLIKLGRGDSYGYVIVDQQLNGVVAGGGSNYGLTLDEVEDWISERG